MRCRKCGSIDVIRAGWQYRAKGKAQRYKCKRCKFIWLGEYVINE